MGFLGPVIYAEVGDTVKVLYSNKCSFPNTLHSHGLFYKKNSEGAPHDDGSSHMSMMDDAIKTDGTHLYTCAASRCLWQPTPRWTPRVPPLVLGIYRAEKQRTGKSPNITVAKIKSHNHSNQGSQVEFSDTVL
jgi:hypothetical protein